VTGRKSAVGKVIMKLMHYSHLVQTRASYGIIDHVERFIGPQALAFSLDGTK
jgi:hypothetical protein